MTGEEYQKLAMQIDTTPQGTSAEGFERMISIAALGLAGASGDVADMVKKHLYQGHGLYQPDLRSNLGDILWYIALMCEALDTTLDVVMQQNISTINIQRGLTSEKEVVSPLPPAPEPGTVEQLCQEGVTTDGAHHKQWFLEQIAIVFGVELPEHDAGIAP